MDEIAASDLLVSGRRADRYDSRLLMFVLAFAYLLADLAVLEAADHLQAFVPLPTGLKWNWFGKLLSIAFSGVVLACSPWLRRNVGLRWRQAPGSLKLSIVCFAIFLCCAIAMGFAMPRTPFSADTLAFQFLIPAIDEELLLRGIMLALLERAFGQSPMSCRPRFGYASLITSVIFGGAHALSVQQGVWQFSALIFVITTLWAAVAALVRTRSGSLLWPMLLHGTWDGSIFLVAMLRSV
jgi:uncharacterized protein